MLKPFVSVIVTTYNWPQALERVLKGLSLQTYPRCEVIVADDGSKDETASLIRSFKNNYPFPLIHCWQPDEGFRAAMVRNKAVAKARGDYIIFLDGDCVPLPSFVANHVKLAKQHWFVAGNRILLSQTFTNQVFAQQLSIEEWTLKDWYVAKITHKCNRFLPFLKLPLGKLRTLFSQKWEGAKTCNLALWKNDYIAVNGLDENFEGWGFEDSDLIIRLQRNGILRLFGQFAVPVLHLWHPTHEKAKINENKNRLEITLQSQHVKADKGIEQYLNE